MLTLSTNFVQVGHFAIVSVLLLNRAGDATTRIIKK